MPYETPHEETESKLIYVAVRDVSPSKHARSFCREKTKVFCYSSRKSLQTKWIITLSTCESAAKEQLIFNNESISETSENGRTMIRFQVSFQTGELTELWRSAQLHQRF